MHKNCTLLLLLNIFVFELYFCICCALILMYGVKRQGRVKVLWALGTAMSKAFMDYSLFYSFFKILGHLFIFIKSFYTVLFYIK